MNMLIEITGIIYGYRNGNRMCICENSTVYEVCVKSNVNIPHFCYQERISVVGNCRICLVELELGVKPVAACILPITIGLKIITNSPIVKKMREGVIELLLRNHPLDCPICDQGGECDLQNFSIEYGVNYSRKNIAIIKRAPVDTYRGPLIKTVITRCIHCTRCIRYLSTIVGLDTLGMFGRGYLSEVGNYIDNLIVTPLSGNRIDLCPVGALTSKPSEFIQRFWDLKMEQSVDVIDSMGIPLQIESDNQIKKIFVKQLDNRKTFTNSAWITDKTRYAYDGIYLGRRLHAFLYGNYISINELRHDDKFIKKLSTIIESVNFIFIDYNVDSLRILKLIRFNISLNTHILIGLGVSGLVSKRNHQGETVLNHNIEFTLYKKNYWVIGTRRQCDLPAFYLNIKLNKFYPYVIGNGSSRNQSNEEVHVGLTTITINLIIVYPTYVYWNIKNNCNNNKFARVSNGVWSRQDGKYWLCFLNKINYYGQLSITMIQPTTTLINILQLNPNDQGLVSINISSIFSEIDFTIGITLDQYIVNNKLVFGAIGSSDRSFKEVGLIGFKKVTFVIASHSCQITFENRHIINWKLDLVLPLRTPIESNQLFINIHGKCQWTKLVESEFLPEELGDKSAGDSILYQTIGLFGLNTGWNTILIPNYYDRYLEGNNICRISKIISTCSLFNYASKSNL